MSRSTTARSFVLLALMSSLALAVAAQAQQPLKTTPVSSAYKLFGTFDLELDGKTIAGARLYHAAATGAVLILTDEVSRPFQLIPRGRRFEIFAADAFIENADSSLTLRSGVRPLESHSFDIADSLPSFEIEGRHGRLIPKAPVLGKRTGPQLLEQIPSYRLKSEGYHVIAEHLAALQSLEREVKIVVYFGSWCSLCSELMPRILRLEQELGDQYHFEYYGLPQDYKDPEAERLEISRVPTGLVFLDGEQVGRIEGNGWQYPSLAVKNALLGLSRK